ncbi:MAG TPA: zinc ABC transporter substrate-binding protein [Smithella sp.]|jgi:zinc transport system substrate-binding protein|nr:zinc ABC transporter substrate-binding protein [Smithella sp.]HNQ65835.1 zinc ABC transporter substrate-binding protein [Smithella sp.]HOE31832.1 zinc ABC transporter substrate-binding protein [Smithella sp.]HOG09423.1 zinc ABC transporter substrate-binding protein [Smithella sp.]HOO35154.1 zinc ABC transporter substrate-binding protein [Smithella sp.]
MMLLKRTPLLILLCLVLIFSCQQAKDPGRNDKKLNVIATIFPVYDFARHIGGDKITLAMLLPPGTDAHHYELKPDDIIKVTNADVFLFTNFELEQWAYKIIGASDKNTRLQAVETGNGAMMLRLNKEEDDHEAHPAGFDPHIWLDMDNAQKMVDNITSAFIKKDPRNSDYYLKNAGDYKRQLADMDQKYRTTLAACKTRTVLHAGHWAFAYLTSRYHLKYIAAYNVFADAEPAPQKIFALIDQIKNENVSHVYYEDMMNPRLAKTIARETGTGLLKLNNGHDVTRTDLEKGETFLALMEKNLVNFQKGLQCPEK